MGSIFSSGLRDQHFGENGAQGSKLRQENMDQWVPDIPCYDPDKKCKRRLHPLREKNQRWLFNSPIPIQQGSASLRYCSVQRAIAIVT